MTDDEKPYLYHYAVAIEVVHVRGADRVDPAESAILFTDPERITINGHLVRFKRDVETLVQEEDGVWVQADGSDYAGAYFKFDGFWTIELRHVTDESYEALGSPDANAWMREEDTRDVFSLPVSRLEITDAYPVGRDPHDHSVD